MVCILYDVQSPIRVFVFTPPPLLKWSLALEMETMARLAWQWPVDGRAPHSLLRCPAHHEHSVYRYS